ncbi:hypothetical protein F4781DRAFT_428964 [Annulohypoxylon bovei var. microspora]|nr:hypothetical protein F4781DRAFT_428964 [Annulohypoxylon bovei var. microspora]
MATQEEHMQQIQEKEARYKRIGETYVEALREITTGNMGTAEIALVTELNRKTLALGANFIGMGRLFSEIDGCSPGDASRKCDQIESHIDHIVEVYEELLVLQVDFFKKTILLALSCLSQGSRPPKAFGAIEEMPTTEEINKRLNELGPLIREAQAREDRLEDYLDEAMSASSRQDAKEKYEEAKEERKKLEKEKEDLEEKL